MVALGSRTAAASTLAVVVAVAVSLELFEKGRNAGESSSSSSSSCGADGLRACCDFLFGTMRRDAAGFGRRCSMRD